MDGAVLSQPQTSNCRDVAWTIDRLPARVGLGDRFLGALPSAWADVSLTELADHIATTHHEFLRHELPRISKLVGKVACVYGSRNPELVTLDEVFEVFRLDMEVHMAKEEQILFPLVRLLDSGTEMNVAKRTSLLELISKVDSENAEAVASIREMRTLANDFVAPEGVCETYRSMVAALAVLDADMYAHRHKEHAILFARCLDVLESDDEANKHCAPAKRGQTMAR